MTAFLTSPGFSAPYSLWIIAGLSVLSYLAISTAYSWYRLRHIPGPPLASISYLWQFRAALSGKRAEYYRDANEKYGSLVRIGPNELLTNDPGLIMHMSAARATYTRSGWYAGFKFNPYVDNLVNLLDTGAHDRLRSKLAGGYSAKENPSLESSVDEQLASLVALIRSRYVSQGDQYRPLDFARIVQYFTLDSITRIAFGEAFGYLATDSDVYGYIESLEIMMPRISFVNDIPLLRGLLFSKWGLLLTGPSKKASKGWGKLLAVAERVVATRFDDTVDGVVQHKQDMLGSFIRRGVDRRQCETEVLLQIVAGSDTVATPIRGTLLYLLSTPHVLDKLRAEIDKFFVDRNDATTIKNSEALQLPYLQAVIYEGLRMNPPFSGQMGKRTPPEGDTLPDGVFIPGGVDIAHSTLSMQRLPDVFGIDVDVFRPERWLEAEADPARKALMTRAVDLNFGYGRWSVAQDADNVLQLLRHFAFQPVYPKSPLHEEDRLQYVPSNLWLRVTERVS
ncbi:hypothetical protein N0V93_000238 [Gnomoniopsis smithogilvyi]|uniref:Cytochrome P450 n=1 Tax=Gnomoniopsis smithogilvyi TaxID=1191159 RepID=A0A9W8YZG2_9PEZI|nr:hypothetical protein N0V93_000238 [Gnomoniopsis smithogilvyi]